MQVFPSGQFCGSERECIEALQSGILDVHMTTFGGLATLFGAAQVLDLPYTFASDSAAECVMDGPFMQQLGTALLDAGLGLRLMAVGNTGGWRSFGTTGQTIRSIGDFRGLRIRTLPSALEQEMVREIGASPTPLPFSEVYTALSYGLLDGTKLSPQDLVGQKLHEHAKFLLLDRHAYMGALWWYSEPGWRTLPDRAAPERDRGIRGTQAGDARCGQGSRGPGAGRVQAFGRHRRAAECGAAHGTRACNPQPAELVCTTLWRGVAAATRLSRR